MAAVSPTQTDAIKALGGFLASVLPVGLPIFQAQTNRVAEPANTDFVEMTQLRFARLATNIDDSDDVAFTGSISGAALVVTDMIRGAIMPGATLFGTGVTAGTTILSQQSGTTGGVGTYTVSAAQTVGSETLSTGAKTLLQKTESTIQLDVHGPNSADNVQIIATTFRDELAVERFEAISDNTLITPLFAGEPRQLPFTNEQKQVENRWVLDLHMQVDQTVTAPQQFSDAVVVGLVGVEATYPPS